MPRLEGDLQYRGDLARIRQWFQPGPTAPRVSGRVEGSLVAKQQAKRTSFELDAAVSDVLVLPAPPQSGPIAEVAPIEPIAPASDDVDRFLSSLFGRVTLNWRSAQVYGLSVGAGRATATLENGLVSFDPLDVPVSEGRVATAPRIRLAGGPQAIMLPPGKTIDQVRVSPEVVDGFLKYVSPIMSQATRTDGRFSLTLTGQGAEIPFSQPREMTAQGQLAVHSVRVTPGPLGAEIVLLANQIRSIRQGIALDPNFSPTAVTLLEMGEQQMDFQVAEQRVYNSGVTTQIGDVIIRTRGSVGLDQSLVLVAEIPIRDEWLAGGRERPVLGAFRGQVISIPIAGSLGSPAVDRRALAEFSKQMLLNVGQRALGNAIDRGLEQLFRPRGN